MTGSVIWVKADEGDAVPIAVKGRGRKPARIRDLARQCEEDMGLEDGRVVVMHEGVVLPEEIHLSLVNPDVVLELDVVGCRKGGRRADNTAEEICDTAARYSYPQIDSPASIEQPLNRVERALLQPVFYNEVFESPSTARESSTSPAMAPTSKKVKSKKLVRGSPGEASTSTTGTVATTNTTTSSKKKSSKKRAPKTALSVEAAYQQGKLDAVPTAALATYLVDRGLSGMGSRKALISRLERFGPVIVKAACFAEIGLSQDF